MANPSLEEFIAAARPLNPDATDEEIVSYWRQNYAPKVEAPSLEVFAQAAKPLNPGASDDEIKSYWEANYKSAYEAEQNKGGFKAAAKQAIGATIKGAGQAAADFIPGIDQDNAVRRYGQSVMDANPTAVQSLSDIPEKPVKALTEATGNAAGSMAGMLATRAVGQGITAASPLAGPFAPAVAAVGQAISWLGPAAIAALPSFGGIRDKQILNDPDNQESGKAKAVAALGAAAVGAIETRFGPQNWALSAMTKEGRAKLAEKFAATTLTGSVAKAGLTGAAVEGAEELVQNPIEQLAAGDDPTTKESLGETALGGAMGAIGGGVLGGGAGIIGNRIQRPTPPTDPIAETLSPATPILEAPDLDSAIQAAASVSTQDTTIADAADRASAEIQQGLIASAQSVPDMGANAPEMGAPEADIAPTAVAEPPVLPPAEAITPTAVATNAGTVAPDRAPKTVGGIQVSAQSTEQLQAVAQDPETPAITRHAAVAAIQSRIANPDTGQVSAEPIALDNEGVTEKTAVSTVAQSRDITYKRPNTLYILGADWSGSNRKEVRTEERHDGDPLAAFQAFKQSNPNIIPEVVVATDEAGKPSKVISPNGKIHDFDSPEGRYTIGDVDAFRKASQAQIEQGRQEGDPDKVNAAADERIAELKKDIAKTQAGIESNLKEFNKDRTKQKAGMPIAKRDARFNSWKEYFTNAQRTLDAQSANLADQQKELAQWEGQKVKSVQEPALSTNREQSPGLNAPDVAKPRQVEKTSEDLQQGTEVERFQGKYGKGMNATPARMALRDLSAKQPDLAWSIEKTTNPEFPDRFDVVGRTINETSKSTAKPETDTKQEYASTQTPLPKRIAQSVMQQAKGLIAPEDIDQEHGLEDNPHITVKYGLHDADVAAVQRVASQFGPVEAKVTGIEIFKRDDKDYDVVVARVDSPGLHALNKAIADAIPHTDTFPDYKPHITLGYVKKGTGQKYADAKPGIIGKTFALDTIDVSDKNENATPVKLTGKSAKPAESPTAAQPPAPAATTPANEKEAQAADVDSLRVKLEDAEKRYSRQTRMDGARGFRVGLTPEATALRNEADAIQKQITEIERPAREAEKQRKEEERTAQINRQSEERAKRVAALPVVMRKNGWEIVKDDIAYALLDPATKEEVYRGKLKRVREVADESPPATAAQPAPAKEAAKAPDRVAEIDAELAKLQAQYEKKSAGGKLGGMVPPAVKASALKSITDKMDKLDAEKAALAPVETGKQAEAVKAEEQPAAAEPAPPTPETPSNPIAAAAEAIIAAGEALKASVAKPSETKPPADLGQNVDTSAEVPTETRETDKGTALYSRKGIIASEIFETDEANRDKTNELQRNLRAIGDNFTITPVSLPVDVAENARGREGRSRPKNSYELGERTARVFGKEIIWITADGPFDINGVVAAGSNKIGRYVFIDARAEKPAHVVLGHELTHHMEKDAPGVYKALFHSVAGLLRNHEEYKRSHEIPLEVLDSDISREIIGDLMGDNFGNPEFWNLVAKESPSKGMFRVIANTIKKWIDKLLPKLTWRGMQSEQFVTDMRAAQVALAQAVRDYAEIQRNTGAVSEIAGRYARTSETDRGTGFDVQAKTLAEFSRSQDQTQTAKTQYSKGASGIASFKVADWDAFSEELRGDLDSFSSARDTGRTDYDLMDAADRFVEFAKQDTSGRGILDLFKDFRKQDDASRSQLNKVRQSLEAVVSERLNKPNATQSNAALTQDEFGPSNPDIRFARNVQGGATSWNPPNPSKLDKLIYTLQDKQIDTRRVLQAIREAGKQVSDALDVYLQEELFHGRAAKETQDFIDGELKPLITEMAARKVTMAEFEEYLHARHAEEANKAIAARNPNMPDGGSGMKTKDADDYLKTLDPAKKRAYEALAKRIDAINDATRQLLVDADLESQDTIDEWKAAYQHYVPLHREDMGGGPGIGQGFSVRGPASKMRTGSSRTVVDILGNIAIQREKAIVRAEKNVVSKALYGLAKANPNPDFWSLAKPGVTTSISAETGDPVDVIDMSYQGRDNVVMHRSLGKDGKIVQRGVEFNQRDERALRMAMALKNLDANEMGEILSASAKVTRYFASVNTQYNPIFGVVNLTRDSQQAMFNLSTTPIAGKQAEVAKHILPALKGIYLDLRAERSGQQATSVWAQLFEEFQKEGGQTGYRDMFRTAKDRAEAIQRELDPTGWMNSPLGKIFTAGGTLKVPFAVAQKKAGAVFDLLSDYNAAMENAVRLSAYKVGKESGMTNQRAASMAKNLTVNFNRKGQITTQAGALYAFFNASVQGSTRLVETLNGPMGRKIFIGGMTLGAIQALMLAAAGFDNDEPPQFVRERSLIIPIGGKKYLTVPMPLGLHFIPNIGRLGTEFVLSGFRDPGKRVAGLLNVFADAFNPVGSAGLSLQTITPTAIDPLAALAENRDWTGKPIARQDMSQLSPTPGHTRAKDTASAFSKGVSKALNYASGGTNYKPGLFSPTPDQIDYLIGQATGGVGREAMKVEQSIGSVFTGEDLPTYKIPLVGRFYGDAEQQSSQGNAYYANLKKLNEHEAEIKGRRKAGESLGDYFKDNPEARLFMMANKVERDVSALRKRKRDLMAKDASPASIKVVDAQITARMKMLNDRVKQVSAQAQ